MSTTVKNSNRTVPTTMDPVLPLTQVPMVLKAEDPVATAMDRIHPATPSWAKNAAGAPMAVNARMIQVQATMKPIGGPKPEPKMRLVHT